MWIDDTRCTACGDCAPYCPVGAIVTGEAGEASRIDLEPCVECGVCLRAGVCPGDAIEASELAWPRSLRRVFSDPTLVHASTGVPGRGTEEIKTNEVTGRLQPGEIGVVVELGRPGVSASLGDVATVARACAACGVRFEPSNPVTRLMSDPSTGRIDPRVLAERVMSALIEMKVTEAELATVLAVLDSACRRIDTVASIGISVRLAGRESALDWARARGLDGVVASAGKTNVGLGRLPLTAGDVP